MYRLNAFLSESSLSKGELEKPAGKGPNSGTPRIEIFAKKIADGEDHMLNDGTTIKILQITMNGEVYGVKDMDKLVTDFDDVESVSVTNPILDAGSKKPNNPTVELIINLDVDTPAFLSSP